MIRRFGERVVAGQRYCVRPGVYAVLCLDGDVLLTYQEEPDAEFQLPGGGIDPGESPLRALHREVFEETGWTIAAPRRLGAFRRFAYMPYMHSESVAIHQEALRLFAQSGLENNLDFERRHLAILERFGRYPHRNAILGRESTPEEIEFLKQTGSGF
ncbi:MAG: DUF924 family protein [Brachymonas sp.]|nr:DUF924 family protein [Brachymonas sp.]